jgi:RimJ/RimL family protein N-acetyltransferase
MTGFITSLGDGTTIHLRPVIPEDRERIAVGVRELSPDSRYFRFFNAQPVLADDHLHKLADIDQETHVAWMALVPRITGDAAIGIGRFARDKEEPMRADLALTVVDSWQHRGVGTMLLALLCCIAGEKGLRILDASVLPENRQMIAWFLRIGANMRVEEGLCSFHFAVPSMESLGQPGAQQTELHAAMLKIATAMRNSIPPPDQGPPDGRIAISSNL